MHSRLKKTQYLIAKKIRQRKKKAAQDLEEMKRRLTIEEWRLEQEEMERLFPKPAIVTIKPKLIE